VGWWLRYVRICERDSLRSAEELQRLRRRADETLIGGPEKCGPVA
jgi:hypothetical protein